MDKRKEIQALDDEVLDQVSGGMELTTMIKKTFGGQEEAPANGLVYHGEKVRAGGLVYYGDSDIVANDLTGRPNGTKKDKTVLTSL